MNTVKENVLHRIFLSFKDKKIENAYNEWCLPKSKKGFTIALMLAAASFASITLVDFMILGRFEWPIFLIRIIAFPVSNLLLILWINYGGVSSTRQMNFVQGLFIFVSQFWQFLVVILYPELGDQYLFIMILLSFLATITFSELLFRILFFSVLSVLAAFLLKIYLLDDLRPDQLAMQTLVTVMFTGIGLTSGYLIEKAGRLQFINQRELEMQRQGLLSKNKELEQFAYIASHDLQEPLRSITSFSLLLNEEHLDKIGPEGGQYLKYLLEASERMRKLIKGLLDYSRLGRETKLSTFDSGSILDAIQIDLSAMISECNAKITTGKLPVITAFEVEFRQMLQNLISNAVKFRRPGIAPEIHVSASKKGNYWEFAVRDNGIGIAEEHQEKVFLIFQRLHNRSMYEGTGIGLANCRKIAELHGGKIHLESKLGQGSTFYFSIEIK